MSAAGEGFGVESLQIHNAIEEAHAEDGWAHPGLVPNPALPTVPKAATVPGRAASCNVPASSSGARPSLRLAKIMAVHSRVSGR